MRDFLNSILAFIGTTSLTDAEFAEVTSTALLYDQSTFDDLYGIILSRGESVSVFQERLTKYYEAKGLSITVAPNKSNIFVGGSLSDIAALANVAGNYTGKKVPSIEQFNSLKNDFENLADNVDDFEEATASDINDLSSAISNINLEVDQINSEIDDLDLDVQAQRLASGVEVLASPDNYTPTNNSVEGHLSGLDDALANVGGKKLISLNMSGYVDLKSTMQWTGFHNTYGPFYFTLNQNLGLLAEPLFPINALGMNVKAGDVIKELTIIGRSSSPNAEDFDVCVYVDEVDLKLDVNYTDNNNRNYVQALAPTSLGFIGSNKTAVNLQKKNIAINYTVLNDGMLLFAMRNSSARPTNITFNMCHLQFLIERD